MIIVVFAWEPALFWWLLRYHLILFYSTVYSSPQPSCSAFSRLSLVTRRESCQQDVTHTMLGNSIEYRDLAVKWRVFIFLLLDEALSIPDQYEIVASPKSSGLVQIYIFRSESGYHIVLGSHLLSFIYFPQHLCTAVIKCNNFPLSPNLSRCPHSDKSPPG